jgi:hypothetical protein
MNNCLQKKIPRLGTAIALFALLAGLSLVACSHPNDSSSSTPPPFDAATPIITEQPQGGEWDVGETDFHQLRVKASKSDSGTLSYQWYSNTSDSITGASLLDGKTDDALILDKDDYDETGYHYFFVVVTNTNKNATGKKTAAKTSEIAEVQVNGVGGNYLINAATPSITTQPADGTFNVGTQTTFQLTVNAGVTDGGSLSYQWYENTTDSSTGGSVLSGETEATLTLNKTDYTENDDYYFYVVVTNTNHNVTGIKTAGVTSDVATVTVTGNVPARVSTPVPEDLKGSWSVLDNPDEKYAITATEFSVLVNESNVYSGTIVNHFTAGAGAGYITIEYTAHSTYSLAAGKFSVIHYKNLTSSTVSVSVAFKASDPDFVVNNTGGKATQEEAETAYTLANGYFADYKSLTKPLSNGVWRDGELTATIRSMEYSFEVVSGITYYIWWNGRIYGPTPRDKTIDVRVSARYGGETNYLFGGAGFNGVNENWVNAQFFTADRNGSVTLIVTPVAENTNVGSFAVAFNTVSLRPGANVSSDTLSANLWADDTISTDDIHVYSMNVTAGTEYFVWWNERGNGDGTKTANVQVQARYDDDAIIFNNVNTGYANQWVDTSWAAPTSFNADKTGTVDLRVRPLNGLIANIGSYGIVCSTSDTRPLKGSAELLSVAPNNPAGTPTTELILTFDTVVPGLSASDISLAMPDSLFGVTKGTLSGTGPSYNLGISSPLDGTVTVTIRNNDLLAITGSPQDVDVYADDSLIPTLVEDQWKNGELLEAGDIDWYKISLTADTTYNIWWNGRPMDTRYGAGDKTGDVVVGAYKTDGTVIFGGTNVAVGDGWTTPQTISSTTDSTVYIRVRPYNAGASYCGTYGIVYSTGNTKPVIDSATFVSVSANGGSGTPTTALTLTFSKAVTGLSASNINLTMSGIFGVTKGALSGNGPTYTLGVSTPMDGTLTVAVGSAILQISGSPKTVVITGDGGANIAPLEEGVWTDGNVPTGSSVDWYKITITAGKTYRIWWNGRFSGPTPKDKDGDVVVGAWRSTSTTAIFGGNTWSVEYGWESPQIIASSTVDGTVFVRVMPYNNLDEYAGTYAIVFTADNATRPEY